MTKNDRANFGSKIGVILASAGSAVGLGNIWRFPYETGNHGGAAFILIYLGCVFLLGLPILIAEFLIGRRSRANTAGAYQKLAPGTHWRWVGRMGVLAAFLILSYYSVVAGWTLEYVFEALTNGFSGKTPTEFISSFQQFSSNPWRPVLLWGYVCPGGNLRRTAGVDICFKRPGPFGTDDLRFQNNRHKHTVQRT